jgi:GGDEF domain-containing protein
MPLVPADAPAATEEDIGKVLAGLSPHMRQSDILGRTSEGRLAVLAPDTDDAGVLAFVERLRKAIETAAKAAPPEAGGSVDFRAGFFSIDDFSSAVTPADLSQRASLAVDHASRLKGSERAFNFKQMPLN